MNDELNPGGQIDGDLIDMNAEGSHGAVSEARPVESVVVENAAIQHGGSWLTDAATAGAGVGTGQVEFTAADFSDAEIAYLLTQPLTAPGPNQTVTVQVQAGEQIPVAFNPADALVSLQGGNLVLTFADGGKIILEGFALAAPNVAIIFPDGTIVAGNIIVAQVGEQPNIDLETAAGPNVPTTGGISDYEDNFGSVIDPLHAQGVLDPTALQFPSLPLTEDLTPELNTFGAPTAGDVEGLVWERDLNAHF